MLPQPKLLPGTGNKLLPQPKLLPDRGNKLLPEPKLSPDRGIKLLPLFFFYTIHNKMLEQESESFDGTKKKSTYPKWCDCCSPAVYLKRKQARYYHITHSKAAKINRGEEIMPPKAKKQKVEYSNAAEEFLFSKLDLFAKNVVKDNFQTTRLESNVECLEEDLEDEVRLQIRNICMKKLDEWKEKIEEVRDRTATHYQASSEEEKTFLRSLSARTAQLAETVDNHGNHHAGVAPTYQLDEEELRFILADMKARVEAIEYELLRREFEPERIVHDFFVNRYAPRRLEGYTQEF